MDINSVKSLFTMISGEEDYEIYLPIIILSMSETERMLKAGADKNDIRLDFLSAAMRISDMYSLKLQGTELRRLCSEMLLPLKMKAAR